MKQPKKLTRTQKECLSEVVDDVTRWRLLEEDRVAWRVINLDTKEKLWIQKPNYLVN